MTRKRYIKLGYALMQKINVVHIQATGERAKDWGKVLRHVRTVKFGSKNAPNTNSYAEAWERVKSIRELYGM
jgi:hypothetical protein